MKLSAKQNLDNHHSQFIDNSMTTDILFYRFLKDPNILVTKILLTFRNTQIYFSKESTKHIITPTNTLLETSVLYHKA